MRAVVQRVKRTSVTVGGELKGSAGQGFNVLIGVMQGDTDAEAQLLAAKISKLRVFEDENGKMNNIRSRVMEIVNSELIFTV